RDQSSSTELVYASCIVEPHFFWCQYADSEDLCKVSQLAQEAGQSDQDVMLSESLGPGSPCLALFSSDNQWYRAQNPSKDGIKASFLYFDEVAAPLCLCGHTLVSSAQTAGGSITVHSCCLATFV
uniref:Tudor domain-containing protein n=1 Tax=Stegastes partitus TaxID=144197 RepID=A0A3B5AVI4_9TELE